jgi:hypothetical protein
MLNMRRAAYISILIGLWLSSTAALMLGMDSFGHPPFFPHALLVGGYWAALCSVALAEEAAEWLSQGRQSTSKSVCFVATTLPRRAGSPLSC